MPDTERFFVFVILLLLWICELCGFIGGTDANDEEHTDTCPVIKQGAGSWEQGSLLMKQFNYYRPRRGSMCVKERERSSAICMSA